MHWHSTCWATVTQRASETTRYNFSMHNLWRLAEEHNTTITTIYTQLRYFQLLLILNSQRTHQEPHVKVQKLSDYPGHWICEMQAAWRKRHSSQIFMSLLCSSAARQAHHLDSIPFSYPVFGTICQHSWSNQAWIGLVSKEPSTDLLRYVFEQHLAQIEWNKPSFR